MSNITVGPPYEISIYNTNQFQLAGRCKFEESGEYLKNLQTSWTNGLIQAFNALPRFDWESAGNQIGMQFNECEAGLKTPELAENTGS
jgi:predicted proteasome-type protease